MRSLQSIGFDIEHVPPDLAAITAATRNPPDLILIDWPTAAADGIQLCRSLRAVRETEDIPLVVLSDSADQEQRLKALEAGADECLTEPVTTRESILRIQALRRLFDHAASPRVLRYEHVEIDLDQYKVRRNGAPVSLTAMQFRLLRFLMEHPTTVFSRPQLLESVWQNAALDVGAVTACLVRLRRALNGAGGPNLIRNVPGCGYALDADGEEAAHASADSVGGRAKPHAGFTKIASVSEFSKLS